MTGQALPLLLGLIGAAASGAELAPSTGTATVWTPEAYISAVFEQSEEIRREEFSLEAARARERSKFALTYFPALSFSAVMNPAEFAPNTRFTFDSWRLSANDLSLSPALNWNLFNNFKDVLDLKSRDLAASRVSQSLEAQRQSSAIEAVRNYYDLMLRDKLLEVAREDLKSQKEQYDLTLDRYKHGMKSLSDLLNTETDLKSSELAVEFAEARRRLSLFRFNIAMRFSGDAPAAFPPLPSLDGIEAPDLREGLRKALLDRPEIKRNRMEQESADIGYKLARIAASPNLALDFDLNHSYAADYGGPDPGFGLGTASYNFTLKLSLPSSFNFYSQRRDLDAARAERDRARETRTQIADEIREEVFRAHIELSRALRSHEIATRKEEISKQNLDIITEQYSQGTADVIRLSRALADFAGAQRERMQAFHDVNVNLATYRRSVGEAIWR